eukprot:301014_1
MDLANIHTTTLPPFALMFATLRVDSRGRCVACGAAMHSPVSSQSLWVHFRSGRHIDQCRQLYKGLSPGLRSKEWDSLKKEFFRFCNLSRKSANCLPCLADTSDVSRDHSRSHAHQRAMEACRTTHEWLCSLPVVAETGRPSIILPGSSFPADSRCWVCDIDGNSAMMVRHFCSAKHEMAVKADFQAQMSDSLDAEVKIDVIVNSFRKLEVSRKSSSKNVPKSESRRAGSPETHTSGALSAAAAPFQPVEYPEESKFRTSESPTEHFEHKDIFGSHNHHNRRPEQSMYRAKMPQYRRSVDENIDVNESAPISKIAFVAASPSDSEVLATMVVMRRAGPDGRCAMCGTRLATGDSRHFDSKSCKQMCMGLLSDRWPRFQNLHAAFTRTIHKLARLAHPPTDLHQQYISNAHAWFTSTPVASGSRSLRCWVCGLSANEDYVNHHLATAEHSKTVRRDWEAFSSKILNIT